MNERTMLQQQRQERLKGEGQHETSDDGPSLSVIEVQVKEWLSGDGRGWKDDGAVVDWVRLMVDDEGSGCPTWWKVAMKERARRQTLEERKQRDAQPRLQQSNSEANVDWASLSENALLCEEVWAVAHLLWAKTEVELLPQIGFWPAFNKALREEAHAKLVYESESLRMKTGMYVQLQACDALKDSYDQEITRFHNMAPATYVCAICGTDDSENVHDNRVTLTETLACGHQACTRMLRGWLEAQLNDGTQISGLCCPFLDSKTGTRCNCALSDDTNEVSNLPQLFQQLLPPEMSARVFQQMAEATPNLIFCPESTCSAAWWLDDRELNSKVLYTALMCKSCHLQFCFKCPHGPHAGITCEKQLAKVQVRVAARASRSSNAVTETKELMEKWSKPCPKCGSMTLKDGGCRHMICPCGAHWCFQCHEEIPRPDVRKHMFSKHNGWYDNSTRNPLDLDW